ncbi:MAG: hypothetical protein GY845_18335 [Planctomycetes bacterium]|nr:hypothetical protein [Planctomycetota bacterium]
MLTWIHEFLNVYIRKKIYPTPYPLKDFRQREEQRGTIMELMTTVRDFAREATYRHLAPETHIRVIIDDPKISTKSRDDDDARFPHITPEEQLQLLNLLPRDYDPHASEKLIHLIETSHTNTETIEL